MRLIDSPPAAGAWNMALDEALLASLIGNEGPPTLRFYTWSPAALSLGYAQDADDVDQGACRRHGIDVVRRMTGGRAVLHAAELTYSVVDRVGRETVAESYCRISWAIVAGLRTLGIDARVAPSTKRPGRRSADCFSLATPADLLAGDRKLSGAAQVRRHGCFLQHGSIKLGPPLVPLSDVLPDAGAPPITVADLLGAPGDADWQVAIANTLKRAIAEALGLTWEPVSPSEGELARTSADGGS